MTINEKNTAEKITDDDIKLLKERLARFSQSDASEEDIALTEVLIFEQSDTRYAIALHALTELRQLSKVTKLPKVSAAIKGVINVRGRIVSVYQFNQQSGDDENTRKRQFALIGHGKANNLAFVADEIIGTKWVNPAQIKQKPISLANQEYITGLDSEGIVYLDIDKFMQKEKFYLA